MLTDEEITALAKSLKPHMKTDRFKHDVAAVEDVIRIAQAARDADPRPEITTIG